MPFIEIEKLSTKEIFPGFTGRCIHTGTMSFMYWTVDAGATVVGPEALHAARIEAGYPLFGIDMTDDTIPLEAGIDQRAISFTKGCFVGQEVVIRVLHRGGGRVVKKLVGFKLTTTADRPSAADGPSVGHPFKGAKVFSGEREVGVLTSVASSPRFGVIALGYVHRDFTSPGADVQVGGHPATVVALPMV